MAGRSVTRIALVLLIVGALAGVAGWTWLERVSELAGRTEEAIATYKDGALTYTTAAGRSVTIPQEDDCKLYTKPPGRECTAHYMNGDEVVVTFDSADPARTWKGPTPGGQMAAGLLWGGIALGIFALFWLWFTSPLYRKFRRPEIPAQAPLSPDED